MTGGDGHVTPGDAGNAASVPTSKSAFIELQQHSYNAGLRTGYHPHHYQSPQPAGTHHHSDSPSFASPRTALSAYPFPTMHQNSYASYHLGSYASQCPSPTKDGKLKSLWKGSRIIREVVLGMRPVMTSRIFIPTIL